MNAAVIISLLSTFATLLLGTAVFNLDRRGALNRLFIAFCVLLAWWSFGEAMQRQAPSVETAHFWAKLLAPWPFFVAIPCHMVVLLTEEKPGRKSPWLYALIYLPALVFTGFEVSTDWFIDIEHGPSGYYSRLPEGSPLAVPLLCWALLTCGAIIGLPVRFLIRSQSRRRKQQVRYLVAGFGVLVLGGVVELVSMSLHIALSGTTTMSTSVMVGLIGYGVWRYQLFVLNPATAAENIISTMPDALFMADPRGSLLFVNRALLGLLGHAEAELIGRPATTLFSGEDGRRIAEEAVSGATLASRETELGCRDGRALPVSFSSSQVRDRDGEPLGIVGVASDISARKEAEEALRRTADELARSNRELEQFAYIASHDLQEPLRMIGSYVQLLARRYRGKLDADADDFIGFAVDGARRMQVMIDGLLEYSRIERHGKSFAEVDTRECVEAALANLAAAIADSGASVAHENLPKLSGDAAQLTRLFQNLVANAIKYRRDEPPLVRITAEEAAAEAAEDGWVFSVADNGIGIDPKSHDRVFVMFQRLHSRSEYEGTGIGLAVCRRIVERHGGRIWVESEAGKGATFKFTLPARHGG
jgi:PAS domain S-box-containing protein